MYARHGAEHILFIDAQLDAQLQLMRQNVEQDLGVGLRIDVPEVLLEQIPL